MPVILEFREEILALCEKFGQSGQSGGSAPYTAGAVCNALKHLLLQEPIAPITGIDDEWVNCAGMGATDIDSSQVWQNNRCSALFKDSSINEGVPYYLDAIVWEDTKGHTWGGSAYCVIDQDGNGKQIKISSRLFIKDFPFTPKTFYIDVIDVEVAPGDWEFYIKDMEQLEKVWKYYMKPANI